jgi:hypothetical protein
MQNNEHLNQIFGDIAEKVAQQIAIVNAKPKLEPSTNEN